MTTALLDALSWRQAIISAPDDAERIAAVVRHTRAISRLSAAELAEYLRRTAHLRERAQDEAVSQW